MMDIPQPDPNTGRAPSQVRSPAPSESFAILRRVDVSARGRLDVRTVIETPDHALETAIDFGGGPGLYTARLGDHVRIDGGFDGRWRILEPVTSLRLGTELPILLPSQCDACGDSFRMDRPLGWICPNEQGCAPQAAGRVLAQLRHAWVVNRKREPLEPYRVIAEDMISAGVISDEGDLYLPTASSLRQELSRHDNDLVSGFLALRQASLSRPWECTLRNLGPWIDPAGRENLVRSFASLDALVSASCPALITLGLRRRQAERLREWLDIGWHMDVLRRLEESGVAFSSRYALPPAPVA
jgi:NAD-dependent DNA ligase